MLLKYQDCIFAKVLLKKSCQRLKLKLKINSQGQNVKVYNGRFDNKVPSFFLWCG